MSFLVFSIILLGKQDPVYCRWHMTISILCLLLAVPWVGLQCVMVTFPVIPTYCFSL